MVVRIRVRRPAFVRNVEELPRQAALAAASLMTPGAVMAGALGVWRLGADLRWMGEFAIPSGLFSHWQVWIALGALLEAGALALQRFAREEEAAS
jgi:hypothetical protein